MQPPNPALSRLGFSSNDRVVILHADDIGMCRSTLAAYQDLLEFGLVSSAAAIATSSWFPATAAFCRAHPEVDMGVHLTLTSEWQSYRWGPLASRDPATGLLDDEGYLHATSEAVQERGDPAAVGAEIGAQIHKALAAGIDVTHIDTHMGTVVHARFVPLYIQAALEHRLPFMFVRADAAELEGYGLDADAIAAVIGAIDMLEAQGVPLLDSVRSLKFELHDDRIAQAKAELAALPVGITHFLFHPAQDTPEIRAVTPYWEGWVADRQAFLSDDLRLFIEAEGIRVIGYRALRDLVRSQRA